MKRLLAFMFVILAAAAPVLAQGGGAATQPAVTLPHIPYRPLIDPLDLHGVWWLLLLPMSVGVAVVYKAVRVATMERYLQEVLIMTVQIIFGMLVLAAVSYVFVLVYVRWIAEHAW